jgi:Mrp family chromosome partitioning ATPase
LGVSVGNGIRGLLEGKSVQEVITTVRVGGWMLDIIACERSSARSSDWLSTENVLRITHELRQLSEYSVILIDLPPMLVGEEALAILPHLDCVLMIAAAGQTTTTELRECANLLRTPVLRLVLNKTSPGSSPTGGANIRGKSEPPNSAESPTK